MDTLTLNNANIKAFGNKYASNCSIYSGNSLNIVLVGENHLEVLPDETKADEFAIGIRAYGDVTVSSVEQATLDIDVGVAQRENFGFYIVDGGITVSGKVALDITLDDFVITSSDSNFGNSIGIHCEDSAYFYDEVSIRCETGNIFMPEDIDFVGDPGSINSGGAAVGVAVYGNLVFDTSGELYFYIKDSDGKRAGIACFGKIELKQGSVVVEMSESKGEYLVAGAVVYLSLDDNCPCIPLCGTSENDLSTGSIGDISLDGFALKYTAAADGSLARYTKLVTSVVGLPKVETDDTEETIVYVKIEDEEKAANALVVFAAYNENGKMTDVRFSDGHAENDGKISAKLDISDAVKVTVFVFENDNSFRPISPELTSTVLSQAE